MVNLFGYKKFNNTAYQYIRYTKTICRRKTIIKYLEEKHFYFCKYLNHLCTIVLEVG